MTTIIYIMLALLMNVLEFKNLENVTNNNLFYILTIDTLLFSLYMFMHIYKYVDLSLINLISILFVMYFYIKEKYSFIKTAFFFLNILLIIKILI